MSDEKDAPSGFKVVDRRSWASEAGQREEPKAQAPAPAPVGGGEQPPSKPKFEQGMRGLELPGFETLISYLSTTALFQLGLLAGPGGEQIPPDLENARRTIDMLDVLQQKTKGNLSENESKLLEEVLYEMRVSFVEIQKRVVSTPQ